MSIPAKVNETIINDHKVPEKGDAQERVTGKKHMHLLLTLDCPVVYIRKVNGWMDE